MKKLLTLFIIAIVAFSGCDNEKKYLTLDEIKQEENAIIKTLIANNKASEDENFAELLKTLADSVVFFGSDQGEVIKTFADYKDAIQKQWAEYDYTKYGEITDLFIAMDKNATLASVIYGIPFHAQAGALTEDLFLRVSKTLRKQNDKWVIVSGIISIQRQKPVPTIADTTTQPAQ